jgi:hypothetical protein
MSKTHFVGAALAANALTIGIAIATKVAPTGQFEEI